jgi:methyl-accepting chemotaxis protein
MKDWKIGTRIIGGFGAIILITLALGFFTSNRMGNIRRSTTALDGNYFPSVVALMEIQSTQYRSVAALLQLCASSDAVLIQRLEAEIVQLRATEEKDLRFYESTPFTPEEQSIYNESKITREEFLGKFAEVQKIGRGTDPSDNARAQAMFEHQLRPIYEKYAAEMQALVDLNRKGAVAGFDSIESSISSGIYSLWIAVALCIALAVPITLHIVRGITLPLSSAVETLRKLSDGDLTTSLAVDTADEVGDMAAALNGAIQRLRETLQNVSSNAGNVSGSSQELAAAADAIASGAQEQAASLEQTSASLEQITATVRQSADNARQASQVASGSRDSAERGQSVVAEAVAAMAEINAASAKISDIISTIDEIAFQTNLLAVNAAVEAARAGEEGRGFAVVATEVRSLAQRSAGAAKEIKSLIQDSLRKVEKGTELVNKSGETLRSIVGSVKGVTDIVNEIAAAAAEQSTGVEQVNTAMTQMDQVTQSNAAQTEQLSSTAQALSEQSLRLKELVGRFVLGTDSKAAAMPPVRHRVPVARRSMAGRSKQAMRAPVGSAVGKPNGSRAQPEGKPAPVLTMASASENTDASFEEF